MSDIEVTGKHKIMSTAESMNFLEEETGFLVDEDVANRQKEEAREQLPPRTIYRVRKGKPVWEKCYLGLDIGSQTIKVVGLQQGFRKTKLVYMAVVEIFPGRMASKQEVNEQNRITAILNALDEVDIEHTNIVTCLDRSSVLVRQIQYPAAARGKLLEALQWEVRKYIPFKPDEVVVDTQIINEGAEGKGNMDVLLVAATKEHLQQHQELIQRIGMRSGIIDASPLVLMNLYMAQKNPEISETVVLLDLGAMATTLNVISSQGNYFNLSLAIGGNNFTSDLQSMCQLEYSIAEELKCGKAPEDLMLEKEAVEANLQKAMEKNYDALVKEIRQALIYYNKQTGINHFDRILLTGGGAGLSVLSSFLNEKTGIAVEVFDPFKNIVIDKCFDLEKVKKLAPQMALAMGLALRAEG